MILDAKISFGATLEMAMTERVGVEVHLRGGHAFKGRVASVSDDDVVIDPITGREFFGAQVRLADVVAVSVQLRNN